MVSVLPVWLIYSWYSLSASACLCDKSFPNTPNNFWAIQLTPGIIDGIINRLHNAFIKPATTSSTIVVSVTPNIDSAWSHPVKKSNTKVATVKIIFSLPAAFFNTELPTLLVPFLRAFSNISVTLALNPLTQLATDLIPKVSANLESLATTLLLLKSFSTPSFNLVINPDNILATLPPCLPLVSAAVANTLPVVFSMTSPVTCSTVSPAADDVALDINLSNPLDTLAPALPANSIGFDITFVATDAALPPIPRCFKTLELLPKSLFITPCLPWAKAWPIPFPIFLNVVPPTMDWSLNLICPSSTVPSTPWELYIFL